jgi:pimeloyl-ACP methyl ester carboxylesterase
MRRRGVIFLVAAALVPIAGAQAQSGSSDATLYCTPGGGPLGAATDAEHNVLVGDPPLRPGVRQSRVSVGGVSTRVLQSGPRRARHAVVFVHGNPDSARDWDALAAAGSPFARMVAFDMPGFGRSDKLPTKFQTTDGAAAYIQGVMRKLGIRRVVLVLHDFGGPWGLQWAVMHKSAFAGAVLLNTGVLIDYVPHPLAIVWATPTAGELQMAGTTRQSFVATIQAANPRPLPYAFVQLMYDYYDRAERCAVLRYYRSGAENYMTIGPDQARALRPLDLPALVIWGERDPFIPANHAEDQRQAFPHARIVRLADAGHWVHIDSARRVRSLVVPFLRPKLTLGRPIGVQPGDRELLVHVNVKGILPAYGVVARLRRGGAKVGDSGPGTPVTGTRVLTLRLSEPIRPGRYLLRVTARGVPAKAIHLRVAASSPGTGPGGGRGDGDDDD